MKDITLDLHAGAGLCLLGDNGSGKSTVIRAGCTKPTSGVIAECAEFRIRRVVLGAGERLHLRAGEQPRLVSVVSGSLRAANEGNGGTRPPLAQRLARGDTALVPFAGAFTFTAETTTILLVTENFAG